jgi:hypothetical protein
MTEPEPFLSRWSRRKRHGAEQTASPAQALPNAEPQQLGEAASAIGGAAGESAGDTDPASPPPDLGALPSLDSIAAGSDIRAFLARGVPADLTRAALRRAWSADPAIRDFVGLAENAWDFNAPGGVPGFGPLDLADEVKQRLARAILGEPVASSSSELPSATHLPGRDAGSPDTEGESSGRMVEQPDAVRSAEQSGVAPPVTVGKAERTDCARDGDGDSAMHHDDHSAAPSSAAVRRQHGGALPQ